MGAQLSLYEHKQVVAAPRSRDGSIHRSWIITDSPHVDSVVFAQVCPGSDLLPSSHPTKTINAATLRAASMPASSSPTDDDIYITLVLQIEGEQVTFSPDTARRYIRNLLAAFRCQNQEAIQDHTPTSLLWGLDLSQSLTKLTSQDLRVLAGAWSIEASLVADPNLPCCTLQHIALGYQPLMTPEGVCGSLRLLADARSDKKVDGFNRPVCAGLPLLTTIRLGGIGGISVSSLHGTEPLQTTQSILVDVGITVEWDIADPSPSMAPLPSSPKTVWRQPGKVPPPPPTPPPVPTTSMRLVSESPAPVEASLTAAQPPVCAPSPPRPTIVRRGMARTPPTTAPSTSTSTTQQRRDDDTLYIPPPSLPPAPISKAPIVHAFEERSTMSSPSCIELATEHSSEYADHSEDEDVVVSSHQQDYPALGIIHIITQASFLCNEEHYRTRAHTAALYAFADGLLGELFEVVDGTEAATTKWTPHLNKLSEVYDDGAEETQRLYAQGTQWLQVLCLLVEAVERMRECAEGGYASTENLSVHGVLTRLTSTGLWKTLREVSEEFGEALENGGQGAFEQYRTQISIRSIQFCLAHCEYRLQVVNQNALELAEHTHGRIFSTGWVIARKIGDSLRRSPPPPPSAPKPIVVKTAAPQTSTPPQVVPTPVTVTAPRREAAPQQKSEVKQEKVEVQVEEEEETKAAIKASLPHYMKRLPIPRPSEVECMPATNARTGTASPPPAKRSSSPTRRSGPEPPSTLSLKEMRELLMGSDNNANITEAQPSQVGRKSRHTRTVSPVRDDHPNITQQQHVETTILEEEHTTPTVAVRGINGPSTQSLRDASVTPEKTRARSEHYTRSISPTTRGGTYHDPTTTTGTSPGLLMASPQSKVVGRPRMTAAFEARMELLNKKKKDEARGKTSMLDLNSKRFAAITSKVSSHRPAHEAPKTLAPPPRPRKEGRSLSPTARRGPPIQVDSAIGALRKQHRQATREVEESPTRYRRNFVGKVPRYQPRTTYEQDDDDYEESPAATRPPSPTPAPRRMVQEVSPPPRTPPPLEVTPPHTALSGNNTVPDMLFPQPTTAAHVPAMSYFSSQHTAQQASNQENDNNENPPPQHHQSAPSIISRCILKNITTTLVHSNASRRDAPASSTAILKPTANSMAANPNAAANPLSYFTKR